MSQINKIRKVASQMDEILNEDYCVIGEIGELCNICHKPIQSKQEIIFMNFGLAKIIDDIGETRLAIDNNHSQSKFCVVHASCYGVK